jgi:hypothetical protein
MGFSSLIARRQSLVFVEMLLHLLLVRCCLGGKRLGLELHKLGIDGLSLGSGLRHDLLSGQTFVEAEHLGVLPDGQQLA